MRTLTNIAIILAAVALILSLSVASALRDKTQLLEDFKADNRDQVYAVALALASRLDALDHDTHMLVDLVDRSTGGGELEPATARRVWASAFQALVNEVNPYRSIALYGDGGVLDVSGLDATETPEIRRALLDEGQRVASGLAKGGSVPLGASIVTHGDRAFLLRGAPVHDGGALVIAIDVALFLAPSPAVRSPRTRLFVTDPVGGVWAECGTPKGCRALRQAAVPPVVSSAPEGVSEVDYYAVKPLGLGAAPAVRIAKAIALPTGTWTVTWLASTQPLVTRENTILFRLLLTALAAALAVAGVGAVILRQERKAFALEGQLQYAQALASARETSEAIVENAPLGVLGISQDGRVVLANRFLGDRLGPITLGAPLGNAFKGDGGAWMRDLEPLLLGKDGLAPDDSSVREHRAAPNTAPPFHVRIVPVKNPALGVKTFAIFEDRSTIQHLENQLVRAEKLITVGVLSAGIAHEVGSPLAVIRGRAEQVLRHIENGPHADDLRVIIKHTDHISKTIRKLLDFSRKQPIERRAVVLDPIVRRARELLQWKLDPKHISLETTVDPDLPAVLADPDQLQQVLVNVLLNACDASDAGATIRLVARAAPARDGERFVAIAVADAGCGIAAEHLHAVFDPFFTTKKRGEGTGLGLPIVMSIVRNHGGKIDLDSVHGKGTTVTVLWPAASGSQDHHA